MYSITIANHFAWEHFFLRRLTFGNKLVSSLRFSHANNHLEISFDTGYTESVSASAKCLASPIALYLELKSLQEVVGCGWIAKSLIEDSQFRRLSRCIYLWQSSQQKELI